MNQVIQGDCLEVMRGMPDNSVHCCVTSPPYWGLRDYGHERQLGLEKNLEEYVASLVNVFREVRRVLRDDGTLWLNLGDSYCSIGHKKSSSGYGTTGLAGGKAQEHHPLRRENNVPGLKHKDIIGIPWRVAFALQADGWYLRQDIIWHKPNPMPESVRDRCTKAHEYLFLLSKSARYFYDAKAIREDAVGCGKSAGSFKRSSSKRAQAIPNQKVGTHRPNRSDDSYSGKTRNKRDVWTVATRPYPDAHFATFPPQLIEPCILAGCPAGGTVLDPFFGSGTTGAVAVQHGRQYLGIELNPEYIALAQERIGKTMEDASLSLEQRIAWLETQVQAQGAKLKRIEASQQLSLWGTP